MYIIYSVLKFLALPNVPEEKFIDEKLSGIVNKVKGRLVTLLKLSKTLAVFVIHLLQICLLFFGCYCVSASNFMTMKNRGNIM